MEAGDIPMSGAGSGNGSDSRVDAMPTGDDAAFVATAAFSPSSSDTAGVTGLASGDLSRSRTIPRRYRALEFCGWVWCLVATVPTFLALVGSLAVFAGSCVMAMNARGASGDARATMELVKGAYNRAVEAARADPAHLEYLRLIKDRHVGPAVAQRMRELEAAHPLLAAIASRAAELDRATETSQEMEQQVAASTAGIASVALTCGVITGCCLILTILALPIGLLMLVTADVTTRWILNSPSTSRILT